MKTKKSSYIKKCRKNAELQVETSKLVQHKFMMQCFINLKEENSYFMFMIFAWIVSWVEGKKIWFLLMIFRRFNVRIEVEDNEFCQ